MKNIPVRIDLIERSNVQTGVSGYTDVTDRKNQSIFEIDVNRDLNGFIGYYYKGVEVNLFIESSNDAVDNHISCQAVVKEVRSFRNPIRYTIVVERKI